MNGFTGEFSFSSGSLIRADHVFFLVSFSDAGIHIAAAQCLTGFTGYCPYPGRCDASKLSI
jgi:hypothetical protein